MKNIISIMCCSFLVISCSKSGNKKNKNESEVFTEQPVIVEEARYMMVVDSSGTYRASCMDFSSSNYTNEELESEVTRMNELGVEVELTNVPCSSTHNDLNSYGTCKIAALNGDIISRRVFYGDRSVLQAVNECEEENGNWVYDNPMSCTFSDPDGIEDTQCLDLSFSGESFENNQERCTQGAAQAGENVIVSRSPCPKTFNNVNSMGTCQRTNNFYNYEFLIRNYSVTETLNDKQTSCGYGDGIWSVDQ